MYTLLWRIFAQYNPRIDSHESLEPLSAAYGSFVGGVVQPAVATAFCTALLCCEAALSQVTTGFGTATYGVKIHMYHAQQVLEQLLFIGNSLSLS